MFSMLVEEIARARAEERLCDIPPPVRRRRARRYPAAHPRQAEAPGPPEPSAACAAARRASGTR